VAIFWPRPAYCGRMLLPCGLWGKTRRLAHVPDVVGRSPLPLHVGPPPRKSFPAKEGASMPQDPVSETNRQIERLTPEDEDVLSAGDAA
jgi:hypothetical protein